MSGTIRQIVVAMDNSEFSMTAAHWGAYLASATGAKVKLVHVVDVRYIDGPWFADVSGALGAAPYEHVVQKLGDAMTERGANIMTIGKHICSTYDVVPETVVCKGVFVEELQEMTEDANLLILGRRGDDFSSGSHLLGTAGERAIRQVNCSCLVVPQAFNAPANIVVGVNNSGSSRSACRWAEYLHELNSELTVQAIHVRETKDTTDYASQLVADKPVQIMEGDAEKRLIEACSKDPDHTLCMIGATGHSRTFMELILGTLTFHVLHGLSSPVLIAR